MRPCDRAEMLVALGYCMSDSIVTKDTGNALNEDSYFLSKMVVVDEKPVSHEVVEEARGHFFKI